MCFTNKLFTSFCISVLCTQYILLVISIGFKSAGAHSADRLQLVWINSTSAICNDGSNAGYYIRRGNETGSNQRWIVYLEGGGQCWDKRSCAMRAKRRPSLMSSQRWPKTRKAPALLSSDSSLNPHWHDAHHVLIPYCSSDSWSGTRVKTKPFAFAGKLILKKVIAELLQKGLQGRLILAGSSAGGVGVMLNVDATRRALKTRDVKVAAVVDSAWFLDRPSRMIRAPSADMVARSGHDTWRGSIPRSCARAYPSEPWKCYFGYRLYRHIRTPTFIVQWLFDTAQLAAEGVRAPGTRADWEAARETGSAIKTSLSGVKAAMAPACVAHGAIGRSDWAKIEVDGVTLADALHCWESRKGCSVKKLVEYCSWPQCGAACPRLRDPVTGEEVAPAALLQSFGLDVRGAAAARGLDAATLARMSRAELLPLLAPKR